MMRTSSRAATIDAGSIDRASKPPAPRAVRIYGNLRTAHLERLHHMVPAPVIYHRARYDFDADVAPAGQVLMKLSRTGVVRHLLSHTYDVVEINEPLYFKRWPDLLAQVAAVRLRGALARRRTTLAAYCIGYSDPAVELANGRRRIPVRIARLVTRAVAAVLVRSTDRLAFGTSGSRDLYRSYVGERALGARSMLFEGLPASCPCGQEVGDEPAPPGRRVLFVGAFDQRKGIRQLMRAWETLGAARERAELHLVGKGLLLAEVTGWTAAHDEVDLEVDPPRDRIHAALRRADVLVLLSQPVAGWREQIGLPILEGLSHGLRVVTTDQTGIAEWLTQHGHTVIPADAEASATGRALLAALGDTRSKDSVLGDLPGTDQRLTADRWLFDGGAKG